MSKPVPKASPRVNDPYAPPPQSRKASQQGGAKFYDGPTVAAKVDDVKGKTKDVAKTTADIAKRQGRKAVSTARRHPWSIVSILTTIPFLITMSLFSTVVCPPPNAPHSAISRIFLTPLGLHDPSSQHSALHQTLCYPANVYHREFLQPYVYPVIDDVQAKAYAHPIYKSGVQPAYTFAQGASQRIWEKPVKPIVDRIVRGARRVYLTFIDPHVPYLRAKAHAITAPYTSRFSALYDQYVTPHLATASTYAQSAGKQSVHTYNYIASHPLTDTAGKYAGHGYRFSRGKGKQAYEYSKPHALRASKEAERVAREILGPRVVSGISWGYSQTAKGGSLVKLQVLRLYYAYIDPYVGHHIATLNHALSPYFVTFRKRVYTPYIFPVLEAILPPAILAPEPPKSFWALVADILPSLSGTHAAEHKGQMDDYYKNIDKSQRPADVPVPGAEKVAKAESATKHDGTAKKMDRAEMERVREAIRSRVDEQGKKGLTQVREELLQLHTQILSDEKQFPQLKAGALAEVDREFEYILKGLDKLYTASDSLTREQVAQSSGQAEARVGKKVNAVKARVDKMKTTWFDKGKPIVKKALDALDAALGTEFADLKTKMARVDDINPKDWTKYDSVQTAAEEWGDKYVALHKGETRDRALNAPSANLDRAVTVLHTELDDLYEAFRDRVSTLKKTALDRIEAREVVGADASKAKAATKVKGEDGKATILPIVEGAGVAAAAAGIIGKGKDQVLDALSQASSAALAEETTGIVDQAKASLSSVYDAASSGVHDATRSVISAAGSTPSPEGASEHLESILGNVQQGYASVAEQVGSNIHDATRAGYQAVGATPSPEGVAEHAQSIIAEVSSSASSVASELSNSAASAYDAAGTVIHDGTRSAIKAAGATPSPEGVTEHAQSVAADLSSGASSFASQASESASSVYDAAASAIHDGTRSAVRAVGATPSPESLGEHAESLAAVAGASIDSVASAASSVAHDATRSVIKAVGATPSPESPAEYAQSLAAAAAASVSSATDAASSVLHDATRSAIKAVGGTPSPETPMEYAESVYDAASSSASSVYDAASSGAGAAGAAITDQASALALQIQEALGLVSTPEPIASTASAYLATLSSAAATALPEALSSGSSILASLRTEAASSLHSATREASKAAGLKPTPETAQDHLEQVGEAYAEVRKIAESLAGKYADSVSSGVAEATASVKSAVGRDEL